MFKTLVKYMDIDENYVLRVDKLLSHCIQAAIRHSIMHFLDYKWLSLWSGAEVINTIVPRKYLDANTESTLSHLKAAYLGCCLAILDVFIDEDILARKSAGFPSITEENAHARIPVIISKELYEDDIKKALYDVQDYLLWVHGHDTITKEHKQGVNAALQKLFDVISSVVDACYDKDSCAHTCDVDGIRSLIVLQSLENAIVRGHQQRQATSEQEAGSELDTEEATGEPQENETPEEAHTLPAVVVNHIVDSVVQAATHIHSAEVRSIFVGAAGTRIAGLLRRMGFVFGVPEMVSGDDTHTMATESDYHIMLSPQVTNSDLREITIRNMRGCMQLPHLENTSPQGTVATHNTSGLAVQPQEEAVLTAVDESSHILRAEQRPSGEHR